MPSAQITSNTTHVIKLDKTPYASLANLVPPMGNRTLTFEIRDASCALANAVRRTLISEIPVKHLTVSLADIKTTDPYVIGDAIAKRIEMIPIDQSMDQNAMFTLKFENHGDDPLDVTSDMIKHNGISPTDSIVKGIPICDINPGTSFSVSDIRVKESYGFDNSRASIGRVSYEIIKHDFDQSSQLSNPSEFRLQLETPATIDPKEMTKLAIIRISDRIKSLDYGHSSTDFGVYKLSIANETHSIGRLLSWYIYQVDPTVKYVASRITHPSMRECVIDVHHPNGEDLVKRAAEKIIEDLGKLVKAFK